MDEKSFDHLTRFLARTQIRRTVLASALAVFGATTGLETAEGRERLEAQGPCGDGSPKANRCRRHRDCCTGFCHRRSRRCRCRRRGQTCQNNRSCCKRRGQQLTCQRQGQTKRCLPPPAQVTCAACQQLQAGTCVGDPALADTVCATYERPPFAPLNVRCCQGTCPPAPTCLTLGQPCNEATCATDCCSGMFGSCTLGTCSCAPRPSAADQPAGPCVADVDCMMGECRCGSCCTINGGLVTGTGTCERCCSGNCTVVVPGSMVMCASADS